LCCSYVVRCAYSYKLPPYIIIMMIYSYRDPEPPRPKIPELMRGASTVSTAALQMGMFSHWLNIRNRVQMKYLYQFMVGRWVTISMLVLCNANAIVRFDRRRSGLSSAPLDMEYSNNRTLQYPSKNENINLLTITYLLLYFLGRFTRIKNANSARMEVHHPIKRTIWKAESNRQPEYITI